MLAFCKALISYVPVPIPLARCFYICVFLFDRNIANGERAIGLNNHGSVNTAYEHERVNGQSYPSETPMVTFKTSNPAETPGIAVNDSSVTKVRFKVS